MTQNVYADTSVRTPQAVVPTITPQAAAMDSVQTVKSPVILKGIYGSRSAGGRAAALDKYAGGLEKITETSVLQALKWLSKHQYEDGSWGPSYRAAMTGLALLTFFAHGESTGSPLYGEAILKGIKYLVSTQRNGVFLAGGPYDFWAYPAKYEGQVRTYEHAIATYAAAEAYNLTRIPMLKQAMNEAVMVILTNQTAAGSWDYGYDKSEQAQVDVSLAGWHLQALKAALAAGCDNKDLKSALDAGARGLKRMYKKNKRFQYSTRDRERAEDIPMTAVAVLCLQIGGHSMDPEVRDAMVILQNVRFRWSLAGKEKGKDEREMGQWPYYAWYYLTQTRFHQGGPTWDTWNRQFANAICRMQNPDGSWCPAPDSQESMFGPVYFTTLAALQLQVYYRFLPSYKPVEIESALEELEGSTNEVDVAITFTQPAS
jgi:hypothetical protein